jgi:putative DNA primase/helicase
MSRFGEPLRERARGRWHGLLPSLGVESRYLTGKHGPCPICREGRDRFRFDDKDGRGTWICGQCGAGDGVALVMQVHGCDFREAASRIEALVGTVAPEAAACGQSDAAKLDACRRLWAETERVSAGDVVDRYLRARGLLARPSCLRFARRCLFAGEPRLWFPAMVARVVDAAGQSVTLHRTYLTEAGTKAPVDDPRRMMPGALPKGSAVRLAEPVGGMLAVAEGIETAMAVTALFRVPCWATLTAGRLEHWSPPAGIGEVAIYADHDRNFTGQRAAYALASRLTIDGLSVRIKTPAEVGADWNDILLRSSIAA